MTRFFVFFLKKKKLHMRADLRLSGRAKILSKPSDWIPKTHRNAHFLAAMVDLRQLSGATVVTVGALLLVTAS